MANTNTELERINGYSYDKILGYFYGSNALVSIAISTEGDVALKVTGAVGSYLGLQRFLNTDLPDVIVDYLNDKGIKTVDGSPWDVSTVEAQYTASYAAQTNVKRVVDVVQQRAVVLSTSEIIEDGVVTGFTNAPSGVLSEGTVSIPVSNVVTFLVERANVFDKDIMSFQGVPSTEIEEGRLLIDDLTGIPMLDASGNEVFLLSAASDAAGDFGIKVFKFIPAMI